MTFSVTFRVKHGVRPIAKAPRLPISAPLAREGKAEQGAAQQRGTASMAPTTAARHTRTAMIMAAAAVTASVAMPAHADRIENGVAVFSALDKVTARTSKFEVPLNTTVQFGALKVTPRVCYSRPPEEQPKTTSFVEVDEIQLDGQEKRIFTGWMFAESPGINAVEHPVFDVWLTACEKPKGTIAQRANPDDPNAAATDAPAMPEEDPFAPRRRVRR